MTDANWANRAIAGDYRALDAAQYDRPMEYAIEGLMPKSGATIWFGAGSTGKTQLLLWLAAHIAATGQHAPKHWLGAKVGVRGHVLVVTAEDLRGHVLKRIRGIAEQMVRETGGTAEDIAALCGRLHIMAFLSMTEAEFNEPNPCLFKRGASGRYEPSAVLVGIERFIDDWNAKATDDDRIVGVILDSAVSMAGFELANSEATTNLLFRLNRESYRQDIFWAVIGHTPKDAAKKGDDEAIERLRGSAMWSTTPRSVVEVRLAGPSDNLDPVRADHPGLTDRDVVLVQVAKANSEGADLRPRALLRRKDGAYTDITAAYPGIFPGKAAGAAKARNRQEARQAMLSLLATFSEGKAGTTIKREELRAAFIAAQPSTPALASLSDVIDGKSAKTPGTLAYELAHMGKDAIVDTTRGVIKILDLGSATTAQQTEPAE